MLVKSSYNWTAVFCNNRFGHITVYHVLSCTFLYYHEPLRTIMYYHVVLSWIIMYYHVHLQWFVQFYSEINHTDIWTHIFCKDQPQPQRLLCSFKDIISLTKFFCQTPLNLDYPYYHGQATQLPNHPPTQPPTNPGNVWRKGSTGLRERASII